jgi:nitrogen fixation NifU-like protein
MNIYKELILDHYKNPRNFGHLDQVDAQAQDRNTPCGDWIAMEIKVNNSTIEDIRFSGEGCAISQASASMLTEEVSGKTLKTVMKLKKEDVLAIIGVNLTPARITCAMLGLEVLQKAILSYGQK